MPRKYVKFIDKASHTLTMTKGYNNDDEYLEIMDNVNPDLWEIVYNTENVTGKDLQK